MANPRKRKHPTKARRPGKAKKNRNVRRGKKAAPAAARKAPEGCEAVKHYGESWDFEHYEKENLKASGLFL
jgi:hypothetical protein